MNYNFFKDKMKKTLQNLVAENNNDKTKIFSEEKINEMETSTSLNIHS